MALGRRSKGDGHVSFETIGDIAIIPNGYLTKSELKKKAKRILGNKNIKTVLLRKKVKGRLRKSEYSWIAGQKKTVTFHRESGCLMKVDVSKVYFSSRLGSERLFIVEDILKEIKKRRLSKPKIIVLFSGVAPYALVIAKVLSKNNIGGEIFCVEINRQAVKLAKENVRLNKFNISVIQGDVKNLLLKSKKLKNKFDFVVAPRPQLKYNFLKEVLEYGKKNAIIYYRDFVSEDGIKNEKKKINLESKSINKKVKVVLIRKAGQIKPRFWRLMVKMIKL